MKDEATSCRRKQKKRFNSSLSQKMGENIMLNKSVTVGNESVFEEDPWSNLNIPYTVSEVLVAIAAIIGNALVIVVYLKDRRLRRRTKYYIISLAIADFLVGVFGIPFAILASVGLPHNIYLCLFNMSLLVVLCTISIFCLVAVSVDRYWAILYPMSYSRNVRSRTAIGIIIVCWLAGALVGFLPLFGWNEGGPIDRKCFFVEVMNYNYLVFLYFATIIAPAFLLAAFYAHIYRVVLQQVRQMVMLSPGPSSGVMLRVLGAAQKREVKATQNLSVIVLFFIICWFPLYTINFIKAFCRECDISPIITNCCIILSHLNSSFNPFLYAYHLKDFRVALHNLIFGNNEIHVRPSKSPFLSVNRSKSDINPKSSIYLYKSSGKPSSQQRGRDSQVIFQRLESLWTLTPKFNENPPQKSKSNNVLVLMNPNNERLLLFNEEYPMMKPSARVPLMGMSRSQSMITFKTSEVEELLRNTKRQNFCKKFNAKTRWSCQDLRAE